MGSRSRRARWQRPGDSVDRVRRHLERRIVEGDLKPGERLVEQEICRRVGCGRSPVREALRLLTAEGLVEAHPRRGARVSPITAQEVRDTFAVFEALETLGTCLAARHVGPAHLRTFDAVLAAMRRSVGDGDLRAYFRLNAKFHRTIHEASGNQKLARLLLNLGKQITRFRFVALGAPGRMAASLREHRALAHALAARDEQAALKLSRASVANARQALAANLGLDGAGEEEARGKARWAGRADHRRQSRARQGDRAGVR
jgi:DNA-binding GntR family transcriptional regulator